MNKFFGNDRVEILDSAIDCLADRFIDILDEYKETLFDETNKLGKKYTLLLKRTPKQGLRELVISAINEFGYHSGDDFDDIFLLISEDANDYNQEEWVSEFVEILPRKLSGLDPYFNGDRYKPSSETIDFTYQEFARLITRLVNLRLGNDKTLSIYDSDDLLRFADYTFRLKTCGVDEDYYGDDYDDAA